MKLVSRRQITHPYLGFVEEGPGVRALAAAMRGIVLAALQARKEIANAITAESPLSIRLAIRRRQQNRV